MQLQDDAGVRSHHYQPEHLHETLGTEMKFNFFQLLKRMIVFHEAVTGFILKMALYFVLKYLLHDFWALLFHLITGQVIIAQSIC